MSDWAAKLLQKPVTGPTASGAASGAPPNRQKQGQQAPSAWSQQNLQTQRVQSTPITLNTKAHNPQVKPTQNSPQTPQDRPKQATSFTLNRSPTTENPSKQPSPQPSKPATPEPFNGTAVLAFLESRYLADIKEAQEDKSGDYAVVYRSLEASSSWTTKVSGSGRKSAREDGLFDLLLELNRSFPPKHKK